MAAMTTARPNPWGARHCHTCGGPKDHKDRALVLEALAHYIEYFGRRPGEGEDAKNLLARLRNEYVVDEGDVLL